MDSKGSNQNLPRRLIDHEKSEDIEFSLTLFPQSQNGGLIRSPFSPNTRMRC